MSNPEMSMIEECRAIYERAKKRVDAANKQIAEWRTQMDKLVENSQYTKVCLNGMDRWFSRNDTDPVIVNQRAYWTDVLKRNEEEWYDLQDKIVELSDMTADAAKDVRRFGAYLAQVSA